MLWRVTQQEFNSKINARAIEHVIGSYSIEDRKIEITNALGQLINSYNCKTNQFETSPKKKIKLKNCVGNT